MREKTLNGQGSGGLLTVYETAIYLKCHPQTVYKLVKEKKIPFIELEGIGLRFRESELRSWIEKRSYNPPILNSTKNLEISFPGCANLEVGGLKLKRINKVRWNLAGYGSIYVRKTKSGEVRWYVDYFDRKKKRVREAVRFAQTLKEAVVALTEKVRMEFDKEYGIKRRKSSILFKDFAQSYLEDYAKVNKRGWKKADQSYFKVHLIPFFGEFTLEDVNPHDIERFKDLKQKAGYSKDSIRCYLTILKRMFQIAIDWGYLEDGENPVKKVKVYQGDSLKERILTVDEEERLLNVCSDYLKAVVITALHTGMRRGEVLGLKWQNVDLENRKIKIEGTKTDRVRFIPINDDLYFVLLELKEKGSHSGYVFENSETGRAFKDVWIAFKTACRRAGISGLRFHDLRHTFASRLIQAGVDIITVKGLLGHSSVRTTERYTHSNQKLTKEAVEQLTKKGILFSSHGRQTEKGKEALIPLYSNN